MIAALRYYDTFVKMDGSWLFAERLLYVDWRGASIVMRMSNSDTSSVNAPTTDQARLVIVGATGMVGGYALRSAQGLEFCRSFHLDLPGKGQNYPLTFVRYLARRSGVCDRGSSARCMYRASLVRARAN